MTKKVKDDQESHKEYLKDVPEMGEVQDNAVPSAEWSQGQSSQESEPALARIAELERELNNQKEQAGRYRDELLRKAAEFENFRKQKEREAMMASSRALENIIRELLPVVDDVKRLLAFAPQSSAISSEARPYIEGVEMVKKNLEKWLGDKGVKAIESKGVKLDVNFHEAISQVDQPEAEPDMIVEEYQTGYLLGEKVIRHAKVIVAR
ncbi:MAG: nucleotide exchange factor GrpE [Chlorobiaceae bacterium]|nr:nucleotide exchange factor GrpE [Chlorobiaceae bacterium]